MMSQIKKTTFAEPLFLEGTGEYKDTALLLIHGFTGAPTEFRHMAEFMYNQGYTVQAVLLPGHGTTPEDMMSTTWKDWWGHCLASYDELAAKGYKRIVVIGHSMGGTLALKLAMERPVTAVVSVAAPIYITARHSGLAVLLQYFVKYIDRRPPEINLLLEDGMTYTKTPVRCVVSLRKLVKMVKSSLHRIKAPLLVVQGLKDGTVQPRSAEYILNHVSSERKQLLWYANSKHGLLLGSEMEQIFGDIELFLADLKRPSGSLPEEELRDIDNGLGGFKTVAQ